MTSTRLSPILRRPSRETSLFVADGGSLAESLDDGVLALVVTPAGRAASATIEDRADALFARYVEQLVLDGVRLDPDALAGGDAGLAAALRERMETFRKIDEILRQPPRCLVGLTLGRYRILESLGSGGMGEVYRAEDPELGREVAVKVLPSRFALDPGRRARFESEARFLAKLNHPHVASIHSIERCDDLAFLVLELVPGETLAERLRRGALPLPLALRLFGEIAGALEEVHRKKIVHRDLKPANVAITPDGHAKLLDFSLGKDYRSDGREDAGPLSSPNPAPTASGVILGTASYMSPEQARGRAVDHRTDVWAFGCVMFEALAGRPPFTGDSLPDIVAAVLERDAPWRALPARTPTAVLGLLRACLEKDPRKRLSSMRVARTTIEKARRAVAAPRRRCRPRAVA